MLEETAWYSTISLDLDSSQCPLCGLESQVDRRSPQHTSEVFIHVKCQTCGIYRIGFDAAYSISLKDHPGYGKQYIFSGRTREAYERGELITITAENVTHVLESASIPDGPLEAMDRILIYLNRKQATVADRVMLGPKDYPIAFCKNSGELQYCLGFLVEQDAIEERPMTPNEPVGFGHYRLKPSGWQRVLELRKTQRDSNQAFVGKCSDLRGSE